VLVSCSAGLPLIQMLVLERPFTVLVDTFLLPLSCCASLSGAFPGRAAEAAGFGFKFGGCSKP